MLWSTTTLLLLASTIFCTSAAQVFQKRAALGLVHRQDQQKIARPFSKDVFISILLLVSGLMLWLMVLSRIQVSVAYPLLSVNYVIVLLSAKWLFHESVPAHRWVGAFLIMVGISLLVGDAG